MKDNMKRNNMHIIGITEGEEEGIGNLFEKVMREKVTQAQEAQRIQIKMNPKRPNPKHVIIKMANLKTKREY